jgi:hypothetical protein
MLEFLYRKKTEVVYKMAKKPKKPGRIGKSSSTHSRNASLHLQSLVRICRAINGQGRGKKHHRTTARDVRRDVARTMATWKTAETKLWDQSEEPRPVGLAWGTGHPREWWALHTLNLSEDSLYHLGTDMAIMKGEVRAAKRRELSAEIKANIKRRDDLAATGKIKSVIKYILGRPWRSNVIDVLEGPNGPITDPEGIHDTLTEEWDGKFGHPEDSLPRYLGLERDPGPGNPLPSAEIWKTFLKNPEAIVEYFSANQNVKVPVTLIRTICGGPRTRSR